MDPRQRRSRERLTRAVLELAADRSADAITVSELAAAAGVNRSTFYEHASSPIELLRLVLRTELDELRPELLSDTADPATAITAVTRQVLRHMEEHADVYRHGLGDDSAGASLHSMLSSQIRETLDILIDRGTVIVPGGDERTRRVAAAYVSDGTVGVLGLWLSEPEPRDADGFLHAFAASLPAWFPWADDAGARDLVSSGAASA